MLRARVVRGLLAAVFPPLAIASVGLALDGVAGLRMSTPLLYAETTGGIESGSQEPRRFPKGSSLRCEFEVLGAALGEDGATRTSVEVTLLRADGSVLTRGSPIPIAPSADGRLRVRLTIGLTAVPAGAFTLRVTTHDAIGGGTVDATMPLEIVAPAPPSADAYLALVADYRKGRRPSAVQALGAWGVADVEALLGGAAWAAAHCDTACRHGAAVLETELAFSLLRAFRIQEANRHLVLARGLLASGEAATPVLRDWLLAVGQAQRAAGDPFTATEPFRECLRRFPDDASCALALAEIHEDLAFQAVRLAGLAGHDGEIDPEEATTARRTYQRALELAPAWDSVHLCLARFHARRGDLDEAQLHADWVLGHAQDSLARAHASLLLGAVEERRQHLPAAIASYRAAVQEVPSSQAARVALSHALYRAGQRAAAVREARSLLELPDDSHRADAWLAGWIDAAFERDRLLRALQAETESR